MKLRKRWSIVVALLLCLSVLLTACGEKDTGESGTVDVKDAVKLGVGCVTNQSMDGVDKITTRATVAAVLLDKDGVIRRCRLDEVEFTVSAAGSDDMDLKSKWERGTSYRPTEKETGGKSELSSSWQEQVKAFCNFVEGKTPGEVKGIAATDGKSEDIPGCELIITDFIEAVGKAAGMATTQAQATAAHTMGLAVTGKSGGTATAPQVELELAAVSRDTEGRITGCYTDGLQVKLQVVDNTFATIDNMPATKREQGDAYNMKAASGIKKEWYEQAAAFDHFAVGKTPAELSGLKLNAEGKTDAIAGCTIAVDGMVKNAVKAAETEE